MGGAAEGSELGDAKGADCVEYGDSLDGDGRRGLGRAEEVRFVRLRGSD